MTYLFLLLPKNALSWLTGCLSRLRLPPPFDRILVSAFQRAFRIDLTDAAQPLAEYKTIEDLFTRQLKSGARPVESPLVSPADGFLAMSGPCSESGTAIQAKGLSYGLGDLVGRETGTSRSGPSEASPSFAWYQTVYLAPHNYHRVHAPFAGEVREITYIPGQLWPVNIPFVTRIPGLFCRNERLVFECALESGGTAWVVMVGALNVGRMVTPVLPDLITNALSRQLGAYPVSAPVSYKIQAGTELGTFMLGSTVIVVYDAQALWGLGGASRFVTTDRDRHKAIKMGQTLLRGRHD